MRPFLTALLLACSLLPAAGCSRKAVLAPDPAAGHRTSDLRVGARHRASPATVAEAHGQIGPGAEYALFVPEQWNGDLVLYTHGYLPRVLPVGIAVVEGMGEQLVDLRELLLQRGFAVGYSSYSENGFAVKDGAIRTDQLRNVFVSKFGRPARTYLIGTSLGSLVGLKLVEEHPEQYAGALEVAGALGGSQAAIDYFAHVRVLFDYFYPDSLPGSLLELEEGMDVQRDISDRAAAVIAANPAGAFAISQIAQAPVPFQSPTELGVSVVAALTFHAIALKDLQSRTHGHSFFDNRETVYSSATLPAELLQAVNAGVERYSISPDARAYMDRFYEPTGRLTVPMITIHLTRDPIVPIFHEDRYADRVAASGFASNLDSRRLEGYGHPGLGFGSEIDAATIAGAFDDLVQWVATGSRSRVTANRAVVARN
jgi:pimeloyl-ACP methyl ester carboxylesterase